jgi:hypothetical protein
VGFSLKNLHLKVSSSRWIINENTTAKNSPRVYNTNYEKSKQQSFAGVFSLRIQQLEKALTQVLQEKRKVSCLN